MTDQAYHYVESGLDYVYLKNGFTVKQTPYGFATSIHDLHGLHRVIGLDVINNSPRLSGDEVRFLRKEMDLAQNDLAGLLSVSESTIRNWEKERNKSGITGSAASLLRQLYIEHIDEDGPTRELIERIARLNRDGYRNKIALEETDQGWQTAVA